MWRNTYKDYRLDEEWLKEKVEPGKGIVGCEMHELNGWGDGIHNQSFGLPFSDSGELAPQNMGFSAAVNGQRPFTRRKNTRDASKAPLNVEEKPKTQVHRYEKKKEGALRKLFHLLFKKE